MRQIRVAFVDQVGDTPGGAERTLATFLRHAPGDIRPSAVLFEDGAFADEMRALCAQVDIEGAPGELVRATRESAGLRAALKTVPMVGRVAQRLRSQRPDLVYTNSMKAHLVGSLAARLAGVPCINHFHDLFSGTPLHALRAVSRAGARRRIACSNLVATSMNLGATSVIYAPVEIDAYRTPIDRRAARAELGVDDGLPVVALIGRINRWKGHDRFVRVAALVNRSIPVRFAIVGAPVFRDADFVPELERLVAALGLEGRVSFHPWSSDVRGIYSAIDLNANCSTREPFGRTAIEAAAAGVATVCFRDSGCSETIVDGETGRCVDPGDESQFAGAIVELLTDRERLRRMAENAKRWVVRFDSPRIAEQMASVIRDTISNERAHAVYPLPNT